MELWTPEHAKTILPAMAGMLILCVLLRLVLIRKPLHIRMIPFQVCACLLVLLELGKQITSFSRGYDLYHLPFHFCSLFIFMLPIMAFYKGKHRDTVTRITASICAAMALLLLIYPNLIYSAGNIQNFFGDYLDFHTVAFHNLILFVFFLILALDLHTPQKKESPKAVLIFTGCFCAVSATMAHLLQTNYANFYSCNIPILESVRLAVQNAVGYVPAQILYVLINASLNVGFVYLSFLLIRLISKMSRKASSVII
jgi:hypothetical protein